MQDSPLRLSSQTVELEYKPDSLMNTTIQLHNQSSADLAYKFKATNPNVFLLKPSVGVISPYQKCSVNITLHYKAFENGPKNFNDKLQILSCPMRPGEKDYENVFQDRSRPHDVKKLPVILLDQNKNIVASSHSTSSQMYASVHKQPQQFGQSNRTVTIPTAEEARVRGEYFGTRWDQLQQEANSREQELSHLRSEVDSLAGQTLQMKQKRANKVILILFFLISFYLSLKYGDMLFERANLMYKEFVST